MIEFASFLLDNARKAKEELNVQSNLNCLLENNLNEMKNRVVSMTDDWKREQDLVMKLEADVQFKDDQLQRAIIANADQGSRIEALNEDLAIA